MIDPQKVLLGALSGFAAAFVVDVNAWAKSGGKPFDWLLAGKRWVAGAVSGAATALVTVQI